MQLSFEQSKNIKASAYTMIICVSLAILFFIVQWKQTAPTITPPEPQYMEVNLGNSETGEGTTPPISNNEPATDIGTSQLSKASADNQQININTDIHNNKEENITEGKNNKTNQSLLATTTKPKALLGKYAGSSGKDGNNQDSYNNIKNQGITSGKGDQGVANGSINGNSYNGNIGPSVTKGDRKITKVYSFNGDVEPATIYAEIEVTPNGQGRFIQISRGSSSNDVKYKKAIIEYLTKISFTISDHSSIVTVKFKFEVNN